MLQQAGYGSASNIIRSAKGGTFNLTKRSSQRGCLTLELGMLSLL
jgi:hypothetical protein